MKVEFDFEKIFSFFKTSIKNDQFAAEHVSKCTIS